MEAGTAMTAGTAGMVHDSRPRQGRTQTLFKRVTDPPGRPRLTRILPQPSCSADPMVSYDPDTHARPRLQESALEPPFPPLELPQPRPPNRVGEEDRARIHRGLCQDQDAMWRASFDLEEIREKVIASREQLKQFVPRPTATQRSSMSPSSITVNGQAHGGSEVTKHT